MSARPELLPGVDAGSGGAVDAGDAVLVHLIWAAAAEIPAGEAWLTERESRVYGALRIPRRAMDWRLGRWVAKGAVSAALAPDAAGPGDIEVLATPGGAPSVRILSGMTTPVTVSLSHSDGVGFAAAAAGALGLGCDIETVEARSDAFVADYFTEAEARWIEAGGSLRDTRANLLWSAKESALKALGEGLRLDTRSVEVRAMDATGMDASVWRRLEVEVPGGRTFPGCWRVRDGKAWTVVAQRPIRLA
jgi:4'-phosphopantetheinyl transferase